MIDIETVEECEESDGESVFAYGLDTETGVWGWGWVPLEFIYEAGRMDIIRGCGLMRDDDDEYEAA